MDYIQSFKSKSYKNSGHRDGQIHFSAFLASSRESLITSLMTLSKSPSFKEQGNYFTVDDKIILSGSVRSVRRLFRHRPARPDELIRHQQRLNDAATHHGNTLNSTDYEASNDTRGMQITSRIAIGTKDHSLNTDNATYAKSSDPLGSIQIIGGVIEGGWILDQKIKHCLICTRKFGMFRLKHHCRYKTKRKHSNKPISDNIKSFTSSLRVDHVEM